MKYTNFLCVAFTIAMIAVFALCSCESKEEKAYKVAMHSNNISEIRQFLANYEEDASSEEINNARDEIKRLEMDSTLYALITSSNVLAERIDLEEKYLLLPHPVHQIEVKELQAKDKSFIKSQQKQDNKQHTQQRQTGNTNSAGNAIAEAVGERVGNYMVKRELNKYFKNYVFQGNLLGLLELKFVFGPVGSNYTGVAYGIIQTGEWVKLSYAFKGNGNIVITMPTGDWGSAKLYSNGIGDDAGQFCDKIYDPSTYQYFFGK